MKNLIILKMNNINDKNEAETIKLKNVPKKKDNKNKDYKSCH